MIQKLRSVLVTDREQADVDRAEYLLSLFDKNGVWRGTEAELEELENSIGNYTFVDLNRVLRACSWLAGKLENYGYSVPGEFFPAVLIYVTVRPANSGTANSVLAYKGETAVVKADGGQYEFIRWEENGKFLSTEKELSFKAERDRDLVAVFSTSTSEESSVVGRAVVGKAILGKDIV